MHMQHLLLSILPLAAIVAAGDVDANDVPTQCQNVCAPVVSLTSSCDAKTNDDDTKEKHCICSDRNAAKSIPLCGSCIAQFSRKGNDNDANDLVRSCSFTSTTFNPASTDTATSRTLSAAATDRPGSGTSSAGNTSTTGTSSSNTPNNADVMASEPKLGLLGSAVVGLLALFAA